MDSNSSDAAVLARSAVDPSAFAMLYERHHVAVRRYVARRVGAEGGGGEGGGGSRLGGVHPRLPGTTALPRRAGKRSAVAARCRQSRYRQSSPSRAAAP